MRKILISLSLIFFINTIPLSAQHEYFIKLKNNSKISLTYPSIGKHYLSDLINENNISSISHAFKLNDENLKNVFLITSEKYLNIQQILRKYNAIEYIEEVPKYELFLTPNDLHPNQWNLKQISAENAWDISTVNANITIAMVDDAVRLSHEDLAPVIWTNTNEIPNNGIDDDNNGYIDDVTGWDAANDDNNPNPLNPTNSSFTHGTHCAGIAAASTNNNKGIASISYNVKLIPVKIADDNSQVLTGAYKGVEYAIAANADIISMSWGGYYYSNTYQLLFDLAYQRGIVCIAAAGNSSTDIPMYPASYNHVISVGSTTTGDVKSSFSNYGSTIDVMAPGSTIYSTLAGSDNAYGNLSGTSMACPLVSGLAALMLSYDSNLSPDELESCLKSSCDNIDAFNPSYIGMLGAGRINAYRALLCLRKAPLADFEANFTTVCPGQTVTFSDLSSGINNSSWQWTFSGGTPSSSTLQNPTVTYNTLGFYDVTLIVSNSFGSDTVTKNIYINVAYPNATLSGNTSIIQGATAYLRIDFSGTPPYNFTYTDGSNSYSINNIGYSPYYLAVSPSITTTYSITAFSDVLCSGTFNGQGTVTVNTISSTCPNLVVNGDFEAGNTGFTSGLPYNCSCNAGSYCVGAEPRVKCTNSLWIDDLWDHTKGDNTGNFMIIDGSTNYNIWSQNVNVQNGENYEFSFWIIREISDISSNNSTQGIEMIVNGSVISSFNTSSDPSDQWTQHSAIWVSNTTGSVTLTIRQTTANGFNDFGIDDVSFKKQFCTSNPNCFGYSIAAYQKISDTQGNFTGTLANDNRFGHVENIGDLDGDGITDFAVGAYWDGDAGFKSGALWILFMNANATVKSHVKITEGQGGFTGDISAEDRFGFDIKNIGDLDGDGITDIAVGAIGDVEAGIGSNGNGSGAVWILFLNANGTVKNYQKINELHGNLNADLDYDDNFGFNIALLGDIDGDNVQDIAVGSVGDDDGGTDRGAFFIFTLNTNGTIKTEQKINYSHPVLSSTISNGDYFGCVSNIGDLDGNGYEDLAVGAFTHDDGASNTGGLWILFMGSNGTVLQSYKISNASDLNNSLVSGDFFGFISAPIGDLNNDGVIDIVVSAYGDNNGATDGGAFYVLYLNLNGSVKEFIKYSNTSGLPFSSGAGDRFAYKLTTIGDWDGNGVVDLAIGADLNDDGGTNRGAFYILFMEDSCLNSSPPSCNVIADFSVSDSVICENYNVTFTNQSINANSYAWLVNGNFYSSNANENITFNNAGTYRITLIASDGLCSHSDSITIVINPLPQYNISDDTVICNNESVQLFATGGISYLWSPNTSISCTNCPNPIVNPVSGTYYHVIISTAECSISDSVFVDVSCCINGITGPKAEFNTSDSLLLCWGDSAEFINQSYASSSATYNWNFGNFASPNYSTDRNPEKIFFSSPGIHKVKLIINDSCGTDSIEKNILVFSSPYENLEDGEMCEDDSLSYYLELIDTYEYEWKPSQNNMYDFPIVLKPISTTTYTLKIKDKITGCHYTDTFTIYVNNKPPAVISIDSALSTNQQIQLMACCGNSYEWTPEERLSNSKIYNPVALLEDEITYTVMISDTNGCSNYDSITLKYPKPVIYFPNVISPNNDGINDYFVVSGITENFGLYVYNRWGKEVYYNPYYKNDFNGSGLSDNIYFYKVITESQNEFKGWFEVLR